MILGISCYFHDSAVALVGDDGEVLYALHEERFSRLKHDSRFPRLAISELARMGVSEVDAVIFYEKPFLKFDRNISLVLRNYPKSFGVAKTIFSNFRPQLNFENTVRKVLSEVQIRLRGKVYFSEHHLSHVASAFFDSPFTSAIGMSLDGVGESETGTIFSFSTSEEGLEIRKNFSIEYPNSVGLLYSAFTEYLGFKVNSGEYKLMGLAPYGSPRHVNKIRDNLFSLDSDWSSFSLNMDYFDFEGGERSANEKFHDLFDLKPRRDGMELIQRHADIAASIQFVTEELVLSFARFARSLGDSDNLVYAGGVALNCVANAVLEREAPFKRIFVQPAAGDAGGALGAAFLGHYLGVSNKGKTKKLKMPENGSLSPKRPIPTRGIEYSDVDVEKALQKFGLEGKKLHGGASVGALVDAVASNLTVGLFRGKSEFGPRALGNRSIIGSAIKPGNIFKLNNAIKYRESFRPFAPMILASEYEKYFKANATQTNKDTMLFVAYLREEFRGDPVYIKQEENATLTPIETNSIFPAVVHLDYSSRVQVVEDEDEGFITAFLRGLKEQTGYGIAVNTSFNLRGEPNVESPDDAIRTFLRSKLDLLLINDFIVEKVTRAERRTYGAIHDPD